MTRRYGRFKPDHPRSAQTTPQDHPSGGAWSSLPVDGMTRRYVAAIARLEWARDYIVGIPMGRHTLDQGRYTMSLAAARATRRHVRFLLQRLTQLRRAKPDLAEVCDGIMREARLMLDGYADDLRARQDARKPSHGRDDVVIDQEDRYAIEPPSFLRTPLDGKRIKRR